VADQDINETASRVRDRVSAEGPVSSGAKGRIYRVIDALRQHPADRDRSELVERISMQLYRLENWPHHQGEEGSEATRAKLKRVPAEGVKASVGGYPRPRSKRVALARSLSRGPHWRRFGPCFFAIQGPSASA